MKYHMTAVRCVCVVAAVIAASGSSRRKIDILSAGAQIDLRQRGATPFSSLHSGFVGYNNPEPSVTGIVSYTDYSDQALTVSKGTGLATFTEPVSINRVVLTIPTAFTAASGAPSITALQLSVGTATNATA